MHELMELLQKHCPLISPLVSSVCIKSHTGDKYICMQEWCALLHSLAAMTPACGLLHLSERTAKLIADMCQGDITKDVSAMKILQEEMPVLFETIRALNSYPSKMLNPILQLLLARANAPFKVDDAGDAGGSHLQDTHQREDQLSYFPLLAKCRKRGIYKADKEGKLVSCTKKSSRHPTLLPGVFTLFCEHGE